MTALYITQKDREGAEGREPEKQESGPLQYRLVGHSLNFQLQTHCFHLEMFFETIYLPVLLSRRKELITNQSSIVCAQMVKARARTKAQHVSRAWSPGPHSQAWHGLQGRAADEHPVLSFPRRRQCISDPCRSHHPHLLAGSRRPPRVGKLCCLPTPMCSKSSPAPDVLGNCLLCKKEGLSKWRERVIYCLTSAQRHAHVQTHSPSKSQTLYIFLYLNLSPGPSNPRETAIGRIQDC